MGSRDRLTQLLDLVQAGVDDPSISATELAERAHLSRFHFDRLVSATTGEAPGALRRRLLLERSAHRLTTTGATVLDIAVEAGYGSHEAYTRAFTRAYGTTPTDLRRRPPLTLRDLELSCPSGVHYQPPGGLRLPGSNREIEMGILQDLVDHHVETLTAIIERAARLPEDVLDAPIRVSVETIDAEPSLRSLINAMVTQEEHWLSAARGGGWPDETAQTSAGLARRHALAGQDYRVFVARVSRENWLADSFVDTTCDPPRTHTFGGIVGHVITFAAVRRTLAIGALETAGIADLGAGDPRPYLDARAGLT